MSQHLASSLGQGFLLPPPMLQHLHGPLILHPSSKKRLSLLLPHLQSNDRCWEQLPGPMDLALQGEGSASPQAAPSPSH